MKKLTYIYNLDTHCLHIEGCCQHSHPVNGKRFHTEQEALAFDGRAVGVCKICQKKREKLDSLGKKAKEREGQIWMITQI